jgi:hypothetical protein
MFMNSAISSLTYARKLDAKNNASYAEKPLRLY